MIAPAMRNEAGYAGRAVVVNVSGGSFRKGGGEGGINQIKNKQCTERLENTENSHHR